MKLIFTERAWEDYLYWQQADKKILALDSCSNSFGDATRTTETAKTALSRKRINTLIKDIKRNPYSGIGDPEPLKYNWSGFWSRRITKEHRLVYAVEKDAILIAQCRFHY
ncbi:MAG: Txe/YoeB family addiction module toxin [Actinomyces sp.]|nr:MAG: Txe/YoeB family addiction module toxin [Actinomyces sp.]